MVAFHRMLLATATILPLATAEWLAVIEHASQTQTGAPGHGQCVDLATVFEIYSFPNGQPPAVGAGCGMPGNFVASSNQNGGRQMEGCHGGYSGGWSVCLTSYGGNVHNGRGQHQRCTTDDSLLQGCPTPICWTTRRRKLTCQGEWHND